VVDGDVSAAGRGLPASGPFAAVQFLTRVPMRLRREPSLAAAVVWFPVVGALIGAAVGGVAAGAWHLVSPVVAGGLGVVAGLLITGAFHEDGLADVADAFGGGWTVERRLEILKDPRHGTYGVAALCASIVIRVIALGSMPGPAAMFATSVAAHTMARGTAVVLMAAVPLATHHGLGADYGRSTTWRTATIAGCAAIAITALAVGWWVGPLVLAGAVSAGAVGWLARRKIGGISGDVLGTCEQIAECAALIVLSGLALHHSLWWV
jgi:adenosylcobinamide-GDP ribazoletransferase